MARSVTVAAKWWSCLPDVRGSDERLRPRRVSLGRQNAPDLSLAEAAIGIRQQALCLERPGQRPLATRKRPRNLAHSRPIAGGESPLSNASIPASLPSKKSLTLTKFRAAPPVVEYYPGRTKKRTSSSSPAVACRRNAIHNGQSAVSAGAQAVSFDMPSSGLAGRNWPERRLIVPPGVPSSQGSRFQ